MLSVSERIEGVARDLVIEEGFAPLDTVLHGAGAAAGYFDACLARLDRERVDIHAFLQWRSQDSTEISGRAEALRQALQSATPAMSQRICVTLFLVAEGTIIPAAADAALQGLREGHFLEKILVAGASVAAGGSELRYHANLKPNPTLEWFENRFAAGSRHSSHDAEGHLKTLEAEEQKARRLISKGDTWATWGLIGINSAVFALQYYVASRFSHSPGQDLNSSMNLALQAMGANQREWVFGQGQWWRLGASMFLHGNEIHLIFNMAALFSLGSLLERLSGSWKFLLLYASAGLCGSLFSAINPGGAISVGASGAILGIAGALLALNFRRPPDFPRSLARRIFESLRGPLGITFALGMLLSLTGSPVRFDNWAHFGGVFSGFMLALAFPALLQKQHKRRP